MVKNYFNQLITGNASMLGCLDSRGELIRLFWPDIDYPQHIEKLTVGITCPNMWKGTSWLHSEEWNVKQYYVRDTNIAVTEYTNAGCGLKIRQSDYALPDRDVFRRNYEIENTGECRLSIGMIVYSASVSTTPHSAGVIFDTPLSALIHYKHGYYYGLASDTEVHQYQLGGNVQENAGQGNFSGNDTIGMMKDGGLLWEGDTLEKNQKLRFSLNICFARDLKSLKRLLKEAKNTDPGEDFHRTEVFWKDCLKKARQIKTGHTEIDELYKRSLLVFSLMTNNNTGALLAAPEVDEQFTRCGRYAYCWGRDAAFITTALDKCGLAEFAGGFYRWAAEVQDEAGSWQQRFHMDGNLAPSWGLQIDEGGSIIWGILQHYKVTGDIEFLADLWPCVQRGVEFLLCYKDEETGLPWLSFDLWEERLGEHAYSSAAVCAGIEAGAKIAALLGESKELIEKWLDAATKLREAIERHFWKPEWNRFVRSIRVKLNGWGEEHTDARVWLKTNSKGMLRDYSEVDGTLDISLLGLSVPFGIYDPCDRRMEDTCEVVEKQLTAHQAGGLMRYEYDGYIGGNPWILTTLWAALFHIGKKSYTRAREYLDWAVKGATEHGLLPEQVDKVTGKPAWVIPLTWSHAMFVLVLDGLIEAGEL